MPRRKAQRRQPYNREIERFKNFGQLLCNVVAHVVMLEVVGVCSVQVKPGTYLQTFDQLSWLIF